ncbi:pentatricopeptide repeat-containing protein At2g06000-like [Rhododendron vialii]|uniref:pentatricopeptide repeat-containing protein At2g06000-like n=1 Tax=Rhododendron vialii TaxID=182163 RepID=UPI00265F5347|nr:pentatricopeptide repeat-containing protein At2g06000-like [Rhododendron vialii]XP_058208611.1 pentatricopeptide repeat-containing protein At2g06000-like [Rhododendron vialii]
MQLCISNHSRSTFYRFLNPILHIVDKDPKTLADIGIACFYNHAPHSNHSDVWFVKVVSTLCIQSSTTSLSGFHSDYLRKNLSPSIAFEVIRRLNGYHCNGKLAFDFFQFTRLNLNVTHSIATYNVLLRSLCQMGFHDLAKLVYEYMRADGYLPDSSVLGLLVSSFAHAGSFDFAKELLSHAQLDNVEIRSFVYNNLLTLLVRRNRVQEAVSFFGCILKSQRYCPDTCTFNIAIQGLCRVGEVEKAFELFNDMGSFSCSPDVVTFNALINGLSRVGEADRGLELLREVQSGNVFSPDVVTYTSVISGYCKLGNMEMASSIYEEMISSGVKPSLITFNVLIDGFGKSGDMSSARSTYEKMLCCGCLPDVVTFTSLIDGYCRSGKVDQGLRLLDEMNGRNLAPNVYTFAILINSLCKKNRINEARDLLRQLRLREDIDPKPFIYNPVIDGLCKAGNVVEANVVVAEMEAKKCNPDKLTYTILIIGHCMKGKMSEAMTIFTKMLEVGCAPDRITVNSFISCLLKAGMPKEAYRIKQAAWEGLNLEMSSLQRNIPIRTNMDIPVAA